MNLKGTSAAGMENASGVGLYRTYSIGSLYPVLQESCRFASPTQKYWLSKLSEPLEVPAGVPLVISEDQIGSFNDQNYLEELDFYESARLVPSPSLTVLASLAGRLCALAWHRHLSVSMTQRTPVSPLHTGRVHLEPQLCQSLTCVMNSLPGNIPAYWSPVLH